MKNQNKQFQSNGSNHGLHLHPAGEALRRDLAARASQPIRHTNAYLQAAAAAEAARQSLRPRHRAFTLAVSWNPQLAALFLAGLIVLSILTWAGCSLSTAVTNLAQDQDDRWAAAGE